MSRLKAGLGVGGVSRLKAGSGRGLEGVRLRVSVCLFSVGEVVKWLVGEDGGERQGKVGDWWLGR